MKHHPVLSLLATGSADHGVRLWDSSKAYCTHNLRGVHGALITVLQFHPNPQVLQLASAAEDGTIAIWDLLESRVMRAIKGAHVSAVTALDISSDGEWLLSAGRDKIVNIWFLADKSSKPRYTVAVLESVEDACFIGDGVARFLTVGEGGRVKIWDPHSASCLQKSDALVPSGHLITQARKLGSSHLMITTSDLLVYILNAHTLATERLLAGHHGEVTDAAVGTNQRFLALGTNSPEIRLYSGALLQEQQIDSADEAAASLLHCSMLKGHKEAVVALASSQDYLLSGSRDHSAILWKLNNANDADGEGQVGAQLSAASSTTLSGHTDAVSAVALCSSKRGVFAATAGADTTLKLWSVEDNPKKDLLRATVMWTIKAHDKDINCVVFTPNAKHLVTASQDKTLKVWNPDDGSLLGTLSGHRRGVWHCAVSPAEQLLASASADKTIKLWSLAEKKCLRTLEGHSNSVLRIQFSRDGHRLVSADSDGIIRVWDVRRGECLSVIDAHNERVWAMILCENDLLVTGDAGGTVKIWRDVSEEETLSRQEQRNRLILDEQKLSNMILRKDFENAALLAIQLEQPQRLLQLLGQIVDGRPAAEGTALLASLMSRFDRDSIGKLVCWVRDWNTSLKRAYVAQLVLNVLLRNALRSADHMDPTTIQILSAHIQPYTEKHFEKVDELLIESNLVDFIVEKIK